MKISKIFPVVLILFIIFVSGCSKNLFGVDNGESDPNLFGMDSDLEKIKENSGDVAAGSGGDTGSGQSVSSQDLTMPGDGSTGSFRAERFAGDTSQGVGNLPGDGTETTPFMSLDEPTGSGRDFGSAEQGMPGDGSTGSFSADQGMPGDGSTGSFSADQGMPGDGSTGSFSAEPFAGDTGQEAAGATSEFLKEENLLEGDDSFAPDWQFSPGRKFGSAEQGMPGDGSTGSFSADQFAGEGSDVLSVGDNGTPEPFLNDKGEEMVASLPKGEEIRRMLPYHVTEGLEDIHFAFDKHDLDTKSKAILKANADYLKVHPASMIEVGGHCDERGSNSYNISLGERRAQSTKSYLISLGVDASRIRTISYGEERPFCFESNEACWYQNRRAHFLVTESIESSTQAAN